MDELLHDSLLPYLLCWQNTQKNTQKTLDLRAAIANRQLLFIKLPVNDPSYRQAARTLGTLLMARIYAATFSFADIAEHKRPGFTLIVDEFQNLATDDFAVLFSQGRKFKVKQFLAHQYRDQLNESGMSGNRDATLSAQTKIVFQSTPQDSRELASFFVELEDRRQVPNLAIDLLDKLDKHPDAAVKEFASRYVWPLQGRAEPDERSSREEALQLLNRLLYRASRDGNVEEHLRGQFLQKAARLCGFDDVVRGDATDAKERERYKQCVYALDRMFEALMHQPITQGRTATTLSDTAMSIQKLGRRRAYAMFGSQTFAMETLDRAPGVSEEEFQRRYKRILAQTHARYCRPRAEVEAELRRRAQGKPDEEDGGGTPRPVAPPSPQGPKPTPAKAPLSRFRPTPS